MTDPLDLPHIERIAVAATRAHYQIEPFPGVRKDMTEILLSGSPAKVRRFSGRMCRR